MINIGENSDNNFAHGLLALVCGIVVFLVGSLSFSDSIRTPLSYVYNPIAFSGSKIGAGLRSYIFLFRDIAQFRKDYNDLKAKVLELEANQDYISVLDEENEALRRQVELGNTDAKYVLADVVFTPSPEENRNILINKGSRENIAGGDVLVLGNSFVGVIDEADLFGSSVRLPHNRDSRYQVLIVKGEDLTETSIDEMSGDLISSDSIRAVAVGTGSIVRLENIPVDSDVKSGDSVIISDERVGEYLLLGTIDEVDKDLAAATSSASLKPAVDYSSIYKVFVRVSND